jgi:UDP-2,3-diacylglucosamine pyrophosphatase LpxH
MFDVVRVLRDSRCDGLPIKNTQRYGTNAIPFLSMEKDRVLLLGDIHGEWNRIKAHVKFFDIKNAYIIQVGDFGIGFHKPNYDKTELQFLNKYLKTKNVHVYVIRGNHDDPTPFAEHRNYGNIEFLPDYTELTLVGQKFLFIGGAVSIDRNHRKMKQLGWFEDEGIVYDSDKIAKCRDIDVVITHTSPEYVYPMKFGEIVYHYAKQDALLLDDLRIERALMTKMCDELRLNNDIKEWYYGHFHSSNVEDYMGIKFTLLGIGEYKEKDMR